MQGAGGERLTETQREGRGILSQHYLRLCRADETEYLTLSSILTVKAAQGQGWKLRMLQTGKKKSSSRADEQRPWFAVVLVVVQLRRGRGQSQATI